MLLHPAQLLALLLFATSQLSAQARTVYITGAGDGPSNQFLDALRDPTATKIILNGSFTLTGADSLQPEAPIPVNRNITITAQHGIQDVLDMRFQRSLAELGPQTVLTFTNITISNERRGNGISWDAFVGQPGSIIAGSNIIRKRLACTSANDTGLVIAQAPRSPLVPPSTTSGQEWTIINATFQGVVYPSSLYVYDYATLLPRTVQEGRGASGGYVSWGRNVTRLCAATTRWECLTVKSADACVNELIDKALAGVSGPAADAGVGGLSPGTLAAILIPLLFVGVLLGGLLTLIVLRRRRQQQLVEEDKVPAPECSEGTGGTGISNGPDLEQGSYPSGSGPSGVREGCSAADDGGRMRAPLAAGRGWQVTSALTSPVLGVVGNEPVHFGKLLGAGSYGRVYRARWADRDVAVKVIEHDLDALKAVENEVALMMAFNHPNVVRAYHCSTHTHVSDATSGSVLSTTSIETPTATEQQMGIASSQGAETPLLLRDLHNCSGIAGGPPGSQQPQPQAQTPLTSTCGTQSLSADGVGGSTSSSVGLEPEVTRKRSATAASQRTAAVRAETWLVQEFCDCGTLYSIAGEWLPDDECDEQMLERLLLLQDCARGLQCLHAKSVVHGDLNSRNVLVSSSATAEFGMVAKLADLGLSRTIKQHKTHRTTGTIGTVTHMPPELLRSGRMSPAVDIYAFGIMMWELFAGEVAFRHLHYGQFFEAIVLRGLRPSLPPGMPPDYALLMTNCWAAEPSERPPVDRLLECLAFMVAERRSSLRATDWPQQNDDTSRHTAPMPALLQRAGWLGPNSAPTVTHSDVTESARSSIETAGRLSTDIGDCSLQPAASGGSFGRSAGNAASGSFSRRQQQRAGHMQQHQQVPEAARQSSSS